MTEDEWEDYKKKSSKELAEIAKDWNEGIKS